MAKYKAYPEYKDSGVEWLGCVPMGWLITELKRYSWVKGGYAFSSDSFISFGEPVIRIGDISQDGSINLENCKYVSHILAKQSRSYTVRNGELLMAMTGATIGKAGFYECEFPALINQRVGLFKVLDNLMHYRFLWYTLKSYGYQEYIKLTAFGGAQPNISDVGMVGYRTTVPSLQEQSRIASFLDHETAKIDNLIEKQQQLIELLKEKRQAVISHAVTKGLSPGVPMKDSGIEWLGEVPEHWSINNLSHVLSAIGDVDHFMPRSVEDCIPYVMTGDLTEFASGIKFGQCKQVSRQDYLKLSKKIKTTMGDVIMARYATIGTVSYVDIDKEFLVSYSCVTIKPDLSRIIGIYLFYYFKSISFLQGIQYQVNTNTQGNVGINDLNKMKIVLPDINEQQKIISHLQMNLQSLDDLSEKATQAINLMKERRTALISAAVTGKIDVRDWVAPDTQDAEEPEEANA